MAISAQNKDSFHTLDVDTLPLELGLAIVEIKSGYQEKVQDVLWKEGNELFSRYLGIPKPNLNQSLARTQARIFNNIKDSIEKVLKSRKSTGFTWQDPKSGCTYLIQVKQLDIEKMLISVQDVTDALAAINEKLDWNELLFKSAIDIFRAQFMPRILKGVKS